jgi:hypothetical protein
MVTKLEECILRSMCRCSFPKIISENILISLTFEIPLHVYSLTGAWRKLSIEELHKVYSTPNIIRVINTKYYKSD